MAKTCVNELQVGCSISDYFVATEATLRLKKDSSNFLSFVLKDKTGSIPAVMWDGFENAWPVLATGDAIVYVNGYVGSYNGALQVTVNELTFPDTKEVDPFDFLKAAPRDRDEMLNEFKQIVDSIESEHLSALLQCILGDQEYFKKFIVAPGGAKVHHDYLGGLLQHTLEVARVCETIASMYPKYVCRDLLITGALLHDCGKIFQYSWENGILQTTDQGWLFGHIVMGAKYIDEKLKECPNIPLHLKSELLHMIIAHHGKKEWGSPETPQTINALGLHWADQISCKMNRFEEITKEMLGDEALWKWHDKYLETRIYTGFVYDENPPF